MNAADGDPASTYDAEQRSALAASICRWRCRHTSRFLRTLMHAGLNRSRLRRCDFARLGAMQAHEQLGFMPRDTTAVDQLFDRRTVARKTRCDVVATPGSG
jgi:hypothetical protein